MRKQNLVGWALAAVLTIAVFPVLAQQDDVPILRPKNQIIKPVGATLLVMCDLACNWKLDGFAKGRIEAGDSAKTKVEPGQHVVIAMTEDGVDQTTQLSEVKSSGQMVVSIELKPVRDARLKAEQEEQEKVALDQQEKELREVERQKQLALKEILRQSEELYKDKRYAEAIPLLDKLCNGGHVESCEILGSMYEEGKGVLRDYSRAFALYSKACDAGNEDGCNRLGVMYTTGRGVATDNLRAVKLYSKACEDGNAGGCSNLGAMYETGKGVGSKEFDGDCGGMCIAYQNYPKALELYTKACEAGNADGCKKLGDLYLNGKGVNEDDEQAKTIFSRACDAGNGDGCSGLGLMYLDGKGFKEDDAKAFTMFSKACDEGSADGCDHIGDGYRYGWGVHKDKTKAKEFYEKACQMNYPQGCVDLRYK